MDGLPGVQVTPAQARVERAGLLRAIKKEETRKSRARLLELRRSVQRVRAGARRALVDAKRACKARRVAVPTMRQAAAMLRAARAEARATCDVDLAKARKLKTEEGRARAERDAERTHQATMRRLERHAKERASGKGPGVRKAKERRQESDDEVRGNIPPELAFLFERVKRHIKGSPRQTRTEAFLHYAEEHPDEELAALEDKTDSLIREMEQRERRANPKKKKPRARKAGAPRSSSTVKSPTSTRTEVRSPTSTKTDAYTQGNFTSTVTGGAGPGATNVYIGRRNPKRPPRAWWDDCIARVEAAGKASGRRVREPRVVCGAAWWKLAPQKRAAIVRRLERAKDPRARAAALALARLEQQRRKKNPGACGPERKSNPREVVSLVYLEQKPGDREPFEYEHEFEGERPRLEMRGGKAQLRGGSYGSRDGWLEG